MKNKLWRLLANPLTLIISFSIIIVGSPYFGGPYIFFVIGSLFSGFAYGIAGTAGIILALVAFFLKNRKLIFFGNCLMVASLVISFSNVPVENIKITFCDTIPLLTVMFFCFETIVVMIDTFSKNSAMKKYTVT